jgi:membrane fusion protein (multidrug efflux system)
MKFTNAVHSIHDLHPVEAAHQAQNRIKRQRLHRHAASIAALLVLLAVALMAYPIYTSFYASTNDAQVDGHIHPVNSRINGTVAWVNPAVEDTRYVASGTILARLDADDYTPAVERLEGQVENQKSQLDSAQFDLSITRPTAQSRLLSAQAAVAEAQAQLASAAASIHTREAQLAQAHAAYQLAEQDRKRYEALAQTHEISNSEYDQRATLATTAREQVAAAEAELSAARTSTDALRERLAQRKSEQIAAGVVPQTIGSAQSRVSQMNGALKESQAQLREARLNLDYTTITAPVGGIVGQRQMEVGQRVQTGQLMLSVVPTDDLWITAYFKETELRRMRVGQSAAVRIDAYGAKLKAHVESIGGATGSRYSLLPPENATGNFVKVVQRVPVRLHLDESLAPGKPLLPGMSVEVKVALH